MGEPIVNNQTAPSLEAIAGIESLGQADNVEVFTTTAQTGKDFYAIYFVTESVISSIVISLPYNTIWLNPFSSSERMFSSINSEILSI